MEVPMSKQFGIYIEKKNEKKKKKKKGNSKDIKVG